MSEYEPDRKWAKSSYIKRDAIIAALADAVLVIECGIKSGTMHAVKAAADMKRLIGCYYRADTSKSVYDGNEYIISNKGASKIENIDELAKFLNLINKKMSPAEGLEQINFLNGLNGNKEEEKNKNNS